MNHMFRLLVISAVIGSTFAFASVRPAAAACPVASVTFPGSAPVTLIGGHSYTLTISAPSISITQTFTVSSTITTTLTAPPNGSATLIDNSGNCDRSGTFFSPSDGRLDPRPADHLAIYCTPPVLDVWGIMPDSRGRRLFAFSLGDIAAAGERGVTKDLDGYGTVTVGYYGGDLFGISWLGGPLNGNGVADFRKTVRCPFVALGLSNVSGSTSGGSTASGACSPSVVVQRGDTLFRIAVNHGTTVSELARLNNLADPNRILIGQVVCLPG
jgi:hypothetical protein